MTTSIGFLSLFLRQPKVGSFHSPTSWWFLLKLRRFSKESAQKYDVLILAITFVARKPQYNYSLCTSYLAESTNIKTFNLWINIICFSY